MDYQHLSGPLTAAVPNTAKLIATIQEWAHSILEPTDVKDMFFMVPLQETDRDCFAFTWEENQYPFTQLSQGYQHSCTSAHHALAYGLAQIAYEGGTEVYEYIVDVLVGGSDVTTVGWTQANIITHMKDLGLHICREMVQLYSSRVKF